MNINLINLLSKLKNASFSKHEQISVDYNKLCLGVVGLLYKEGFIQSFSIEEKTVNNVLKSIIKIKFANLNQYANEL